MLRKMIIVLIAAFLFFQGCQNQNSGSLTIGTAGTTGTYYVVAAGMAQTINRISDTINITVQATRGSVENINLTNTGELDLGMSNADGVYWATTGTGIYEGRPQNISVVMSLYLSVGQMAVHQRSNISSYADLRGRRVVLGPPGTTIPEMSRAILRAYGIDPENDIRPVYLAFDEGLSELQDGTVDAAFFVAAAPTAAMVNASSGGAIRLIDVPDDILARVSLENPYFTPYIIPMGTYNGMEGDIRTLKIMTEIFANNDISEDKIYEFVKTALENTADFAASHVAAREINFQTAASSVSRYHPGALRYFREVGVLP